MARCGSGWKAAESPIPHPWLDALARPNRPPLVEALAVYFDPDTSPEEVMAFQAMAGVLTPAKCPSELFVLTRKRPAGWPLLEGGRGRSSTVEAPV